MQNFEKLSRVQMKNVMGGYVQPPCASGQSAYNCISFIGNSSVSGIVCSTSASGASTQQIDSWRAQGTWGGDGFTQVNCSAA